MKRELEHLLPADIERRSFEIISAELEGRGIALLEETAPIVKRVIHTTADFELALHSGLYAAFYYMRAAFPYLKRAKGLVINLASGAGLSGKSGQSSYAAAKEGIRGLSRVAATEWGEFGVRVNVVCPLVMTQALEQWSRDYPQLYRDTIKHIPLQRFGDAEKDIGRLCVFLASEDASYITGQTIEIQGDRKSVV